MRATLNQPVPLQVAASDGRTDLFGQAKILTAAGALLATVNLPHLALGVYGATYTPTAEQYLAVVYQFYTDSGRTQLASYDLQTEGIEVCSDKTNVMRLLGLAHENAVFDQQVYDSGGNLTGGRLRVFDSKANAQIENAAGLLFQYTIAAVYTSGKLSRYSIVRDQ